MSFSPRPGRPGVGARLAGMALLGVLAGLSLAQPSSAAQEPAGPQVTFSGGGLGLLLCGSRPDVPQITVGAESKVRLTNGLGLDATLKIDGAVSASVANGETVEVQFHRGPVAIGMEPDCALNLNQDFEQLTVEVTPGRTNPAPAPTGSKPSNRPSTSAPTTGAASPDDPQAPEPPSGEIFPMPSGLPSDGSDPAVGGTLKSPATVVNPDGSPAQRLASSTGPVDKGPIGLLAIIATVCVVGVSVGAIRAIITQRATRTEFA